MRRITTKIPKLVKWQYSHLITLGMLWKILLNHGFKCLARNNIDLLREWIFYNSTIRNISGSMAVEWKINMAYIYQIKCDRLFVAKDKLTK